MSDVPLASFMRAYLLRSPEGAFWVELHDYLVNDDEKSIGYVRCYRIERARYARSTWFRVGDLLTVPVADLDDPQGDEAAAFLSRVRLG